MKYTLVLILSISLQGLFGQSLEGLWLIDKVSMGAEENTPDAKWIQLAADGSFIGGNGFLQNSAGTYEFKEEDLLLNDSLSLRDEFGAFKVMLNNKTMTWERKEDGQSIKVSLKRINELPMAQSDLLRGLWQAGNEYRLFLRWDRAYVKYLPDGSKEYGVWRNHPHKPELALIPWNQKKTLQFYKIEESSFNRLKLIDLEGGKATSLERLRQF